jgi:hypothetical protein
MKKTHMRHTGFISHTRFAKLESKDGLIHVKEKRDSRANVVIDRSGQTMLESDYKALERTINRKKK